MAENFGDIASEPDLASKIAAEIMGLKWTHSETGEEQCQRHGQLQEIVAKHLAAPTAKGGTEGMLREALTAVLDRILAPDYGGIDDTFWMTPSETVVDYINTALEALPAGAAGGGSSDLGAQGGVTLTELHFANTTRQAEWCPDQLPDLSFRGNELAGETGEACNVIKKLERERQGWRGSRATLGQLAEELADVVICADLCAVTAGIDLDAAVRAKFNATSEKVGLATKLPTSPSGVETVRQDNKDGES